MEFQTNQRPSTYTIKEAQAELKAELQNHQQRDSRDNYCLLWSGEGGIGKSSAIKQVADEVSCRFRSWHHGATIEEDNHGVQFRDGNTTRWAVPEHLADIIDSRDPGILFIDEIFSGQTIGHQNFVRMIIDRKFHGHDIAPGWVIVGATNPEGSDYLSVRSVDKAVSERMLTYHIEPSPEELLEYWSKTMPEQMYAFLLINHHEGKLSILKALSPRGWMKVARAVDRRLKAGVSHEQIFKLLCVNGSIEMASAFKTFLTHGSNPDMYPLSYAEIVKDTSWTNRVANWLDKKRNGLIAASNWNLLLAMRGRAKRNELTKDEINNAAEFLIAIGLNGYSEMSYTTVLSLMGTVHMAAMSDRFKNTRLIDRLNQLLAESKDARK